MINAKKLIESCYNRLPNDMKNRPWEHTQRGIAVSEEGKVLDAYMAAYGEMHITKCRAALQNFPFEDLNQYQYEIFDWGCGQGIATATLLEMLGERGLLSGLKKITLIEPSSAALKRAKEWVRGNAGERVEIQLVKAYIPSCETSEMKEVACTTQASINLFSNILDVKGISLSWLAKKTASLAIRNYMICVGPKYGEGKNTRIDDFCGYFQPQEYFSSISTPILAYTTRTNHQISCEARCFLHKRETCLQETYQERANELSENLDYDYAAECMQGIVSDSLLRLYDTLRERHGKDLQVMLRPMINSDRVDIVVAERDAGIILINEYDKDNDKGKDEREKIEEQCERLKFLWRNMFESHIKSLKIDAIEEHGIWGAVQTVLYVPGKSKEELNKIVSQESENNKKQYTKFISDDEDLTNMIEGLKKKPNLFKEEHYDELIEIIVGKWHSYKDGDLNFNLTEYQKKIVRDERKRIRYKGVAGCGKTQIVANRAVERHLKTGSKVLIITFNISLIQYIRMRINQVPADFSTTAFEINNYHQFFKSKANQYAQCRLQMGDWDDKNFFRQYAEKIEKYKTIIIDEVQDFKEEWLYTLVTYFLDKDGSVSVFGDGEQNIYAREMDKETKMPPMREMGFSGRWPEISERQSMRIQNPDIAEIASKFADKFISAENKPIEAGLRFPGNEVVKYDKDKCSQNMQPWNEFLARSANHIIEKYRLSTKDVAVVGAQIKLLRGVAYSYSKLYGQKVMTTFETEEDYKKITSDTNKQYAYKDLESIRRVAKIHFTTNCEELKMSTIHSFKGWESDTIILILQQEVKNQRPTPDFEDEGKVDYASLIYTAMTRAKRNLFIINVDNDTYHEFFVKNIKE